jgi:cobalt-zinc-cadmium resistance protein CzcA
VLTALIDWSLRNRFLVAVGGVGFVALGLFSLTGLNVDAFPDTTPVQVQINTIAPGLAPGEVESQITAPVEQGIGGLPGLRQVRSVSKFGLSQVVATFADGTDVYFARQQIAERLGSVELPGGMPRPTLGPVATGMGEVFHYLVTSDRGDRTELRTLQDWVVRPALRTVPGTAEINGWGGLQKQYQVHIDPDRLLKYDVTFDQVVRALHDNNLNVGGGSLDRAGEMLLVSGTGRTTTVDQIRAVPVTARKGVLVLVGDVAKVRTGAALRMGGVTADGRGEVVLGLGFLLMGENGRDVTRGLEKKLDQVKQTLPPGVHVTTVYARTELMNRVTGTVRGNLFEGGLLVVAVLFIFLGNLRAGLVVALAIPLSLLFAFCGMLRFGIAASLLSLGALDFGLVVDSSVVMVENVMRHFGHDPADGRPRQDRLRDAVIEVRQPTLFGELIIMIVYLPILTLEGVEGKLFRPMALTVIFALLGSLVLSLTLMPVLAGLLLPRHGEPGASATGGEPGVVRLARAVYTPVIRTALRHRLAVLLTAALALGVAVLAARDLGSEFVPRLSEGALVVNIVRLPGTSLEESLRDNTRMEKALLAAFPDEVEHVWSRCGTAEVATDPMGPEETDMFITLRPRSQWRRARTQDEVVELISREFAVFPGQRLSFTQPIEQRVNEMISGVRGDVAVRLFGDDFDVLTRKARDLQRVLESIDGSADVSVEQLTGQPLLQVRVRQAAIQRYGVSARSVLELVQALGGTPAGEVFEGQLRFPLAVWLPDRLRAGPEAVAGMLVTLPTGERLPLSRLADVKVTEGPARIMHEAGQRRIVVQRNVRGRDLGSFVAEAQRRVAERVPLPPGRYHLEWGGQFENLQRAEHRLEIVVPAALGLIFVLLYLTYGRLGDVLLVFVAVPFACVGGLLALWLRGLPFSISAGVGFIALSGVSVLNSMVLVTFIRHLLERGVPLDRAVEEAARTRLRPVLMTALVASLGFLPMALSTGVGAEVQRPLATVVIGGVISSTVLTLLVLPVLYDLVEGFLSGRGPAGAWRTRMAGSRLLLPFRRPVSPEGAGDRNGQFHPADGLAPAGGGREQPPV